LAEVKAIIKANGKTFGIGLIGGSGTKNNIVHEIKKYKLATRLNCSKRFLGKKFQNVYLNKLRIC
jgi:hypothetical protein